MEKRRRYTIVGSVAGGLLLFLVYFFSMYARLSAATVVRMLVFPTAFGAAAGALVGRELSSLRRGAEIATHRREEGRSATAADDDKVEQKNCANVEERAE